MRARARSSQVGASLRQWLKERRSGAQTYAVRAVARILRDADQLARPASDSVERAAKLSRIASGLTEGVEVVVRFTGSEANLYQIRPWLGPLERLHERHRVLIVPQNVDAAHMLATETPLRVVAAPSVAEYEVLVDNADFKICFYVNHVSSNFTAMRFPDMLHVNIGHGESDKVYMASNQAKAYDYLYVAGDAAIERYRRNLIGFSPEKLIPVGRPQLDFAVPCLVESERPTVLYAPTWEGDRPSMQYSSVPTFGTDILRELLGADAGLRVVFRPHPFTGSRREDAAERLDEMLELMRSAQQADPGAGHLVDTDSDFTSLAASADVLIADNSAVITDFLGLDRPYFVTVPESAESPLPPGGMWEAGSTIDRAGVTGLAARVTAAALDDPMKEDRRKVAGYYFGDVAPGASVTRFVDATSRLISERDALVAEKYAEVN